MTFTVTYFVRFTAFQNMSLAAQMQERQEMNALKLKEAKKSATSTKSVK
jgi:hypothetical protein